MFFTRTVLSSRISLIIKFVCALTTHFENRRDLKAFRMAFYTCICSYGIHGIYFYVSVYLPNNRRSKFYSLKGKMCNRPSPRLRSTVRSRTIDPLICLHSVYIIFMLKMSIIRIFIYSTYSVPVFYQIKFIILVDRKFYMYIDIEEIARISYKSFFPPNDSDKIICFSSGVCFFLMRRIILS